MHWSGRRPPGRTGSCRRPGSTITEYVLSVPMRAGCPARRRPAWRCPRPGWCVHEALSVPTAPLWVPPRQAHRRVVHVAEALLQALHERRSLHDLLAQSQRSRSALCTPRSPIAPTKACPFCRRTSPLALDAPALGGPPCEKAVRNVITLPMAPLDRSLLGLLVQRGQPLVVADHQEPAGVLGRLDHGLGLVVGGSHGLLAQHVLAGLQGGHGDGACRALGVHTDTASTSLRASTSCHLS